MHFGAPVCRDPLAGLLGAQMRDRLREQVATPEPDGSLEGERASEQRLLLPGAELLPVRLHGKPAGRAAAVARELGEKRLWIARAKAVVPGRHIARIEVFEWHAEIAALGNRVAEEVAARAWRGREKPEARPAFETRQVHAWGELLFVGARSSRYKLVQSLQQALGGWDPNRHCASLQCRHRREVANPFGPAAGCGKESTIVPEGRKWGWPSRPCVLRLGLHATLRPTRGPRPQLRRAARRLCRDPRRPRRAGHRAGGAGSASSSSPAAASTPARARSRALHRECREETGWRIRVLRRIGAYQRYAYMPEYGLWAHKVCAVYLARPVRRLGAADRARPPGDLDADPDRARAARASTATARSSPWRRGSRRAALNDSIARGSRLDRLRPHAVRADAGTCRILTVGKIRPRPPLRGADAIDASAGAAAPGLQPAVPSARPFASALARSGERPGRGSASAFSGRSLAGGGPLRSEGGASRSERSINRAGLN